MRPLQSAAAVAVTASGSNPHLESTPLLESRWVPLRDMQARALIESTGSSPLCLCSSARGVRLKLFVQRPRQPAADCVCYRVEPLCDRLAYSGSHVTPLLEGILSTLHRSVHAISLPCSMFSWLCTRCACPQSLPTRHIYRSLPTVPRTLRAWAAYYRHASG